MKVSQKTKKLYVYCCWDIGGGSNFKVGGGGVRAKLWTSPHDNYFNNLTRGKLSGLISKDFKALKSACSVLSYKIPKPQSFNTKLLLAIMAIYSQSSETGQWTTIIINFSLCMVSMDCLAILDDRYLINQITGYRIAGNFQWRKLLRICEIIL